MNQFCRQGKSECMYVVCIVSSLWSCQESGHMTRQEVSDLTEQCLCAVICMWQWDAALQKLFK